MSVFEQDVSDVLGGWIIPVTFVLTFLLIARLIISDIWFSISLAFC